MNQLLKVSLGRLPNIIVSDPSFKDSSWNQLVIGEARKIGLTEPKICICTVDRFHQDPFDYAVDTACSGRVGTIQTILLKSKQNLLPLKEELRRNRTGLYAVHIQLQLERFQDDADALIHKVIQSLNA